MTNTEKFIPPAPRVRVTEAQIEEIQAAAWQEAHDAFCERGSLLGCDEHDNPYKEN